ncbi:hypothetical protein ACVWY2_003303 [Bradyrhizobium sp. JR6.1]
MELPQAIRIERRDEFREEVLSEAIDLPANCADLSEGQLIKLIRFHAFPYQSDVEVRWSASGPTELVSELYCGSRGKSVSLGVNRRGVPTPIGAISY